MRGIEFAIDTKLGCRREIQELLDLAHHVHLAPTVQNVDAFFLCDDGIAIEVRRALLELSEVFHRLQRSLRSEEALNIDSTQRCRVDPVPKLLRANIAYKMR